ncbi:MAG: rRNA maturation RNase YbeY [Patescibacteria group bacterium]|nr:rRNA maturation RNase YbeY [Patescibacteria group bacterium]
MVSFEVNQQAGKKIPDKVWRQWLNNIDQVVKIGPRELSVAVVGDMVMRRLNKTYRGQDKITDVLSFGEESRRSTYLGEVIICYPRAVQQAKKFNHSTATEFKKLLVHGVLHLMGYNHEIDADAEVMESLEDKIMKGK